MITEWTGSSSEEVRRWRNSGIKNPTRTLSWFEENKSGLNDKAKGILAKSNAVWVSQSMADEVVKCKDNLLSIKQEFDDLMKRIRQL